VTYTIDKCAHMRETERTSRNCKWQPSRIRIYSVQQTSSQWRAQIRTISFFSPLSSWPNWT